MVPLRCLSINVELTTISNPSSPLASQKSQFEMDVLEKPRHTPLTTLSASNMRQQRQTTPEKFQAQEPPSNASVHVKERSPSVSSMSANVELAHTNKLDCFLLKTCQVVLISKFKDRVWYRLESTTLSDHRRYLCRYYQDFYQLHCQLIEEMDKLGRDVKKLPVLPTPIANSKKLELPSNRLRSFNQYLEALLSSEHIPDMLKRSVFYDQWLCPRVGDLVQSPRGSVYKFEMNGRGQLTWQNISTDSTVSHQELICQNLYPTTQFDRSLSISTCSSPRQQKASFSSNPSSQPVSPMLSQKTSSFSFNNNNIKIKINFGDDCYVVKCHLTDIDSWEKFRAIVHSRLIKDIPDPHCSLNIRLKSNSDAKLVTLDATNFDIDHLLYLSHNHERNFTYTQFNATTPHQNNHSIPILKVNLEVCI